MNFHSDSQIYLRGFSSCLLIKSPTPSLLADEALTGRPILHLGKLRHSQVLRINQDPWAHTQMK